MIDWQWRSLGELTALELYRIAAAREAVFVVEQSCVYQELDGLDLEAHHLIGWSQGEVAAYLRVLGPGVRFAEASIGRVLTAQSFRGCGLGRESMQVALRFTAARFPAQPLRISAQAHLTAFYDSFGFRVASAGYLEDGIPHVEMLRPVTV